MPLNKLENFIKNTEGRILYVKSDGGVLPEEEVLTRPVGLIRSGPAAGTYGTLHMCNLMGIKNAIAFDMGGTSAEASLIRDGEIELADEVELKHELKIRVPTVYFTLIGAGGGSIAWMDSDDVFRVGPRSAGADPGSACYGKGGVEPTVTDANLLLGIIDPTYFLGGKLQLHKPLSQNAFTSLSTRLNLTPVAVAEGTRKVIISNMAQVLRQLTLERGIDPREFTMVAYGGASGQHIVHLASELNIKKVIIPNYPAHHSAFGAVAASLTYTTSKTLWIKLSDINSKNIETDFRTLENEIYNTIGKYSQENNLRIIRRIDMRYEGQWHEVTIQVPNELSSKSLDEIRELFDRTHREKYGVEHYDLSVELVTIRSTGIIAVSPPHIKELENINYSKAKVKSRRVITIGGKSQEVNIYERSTLSLGDTIYGCCIIEEPSTTILIPEGCTAEVDKYGNVLIEINMS